MDPAQITVRFRRYNATPLMDFAGISPDQMHHLLYEPFGPQSPVRLQADLPTDVLDQIPLFRLTEELLRLVARDGSIKLTPLGALPRTYLHELYGFGFLPEEYIEAGYVRLSREIDSPVLTTVHHTTVMAGLLKKIHGRLTLTKKGEQLRQPSQRAELCRLLLATFTQKFNWSYHDGYDSPTAGQQGWAFSIYLLLRFGGEARPARFYADKYRAAFPFFLPEFQDSSYTSREEQLASCYITRTFDRFAVWFGLATIEPHWNEGHETVQLVTPTSLLARVFHLAAAT